MASSHTPRQNHLLAALPELDYATLLPHLDLVPMPLGHVVSESWGQLRHVYFPTTAIVSRLYYGANRGSSEVTMVGNEGMIGIALFMGGDSIPSRAVVAKAGFGYGLAGHVLQQELNGCGALQRLLLLYMQATLTRIAQTAECNRHHALNQRLCRWLLATFDRLPPGEDIVMTQEIIAGLLGVDREGLARTVTDLQRAGLIACHGCHISLLDRAGLESRSCRCYTVAKKEWDRLFPAQGLSANVPLRFESDEYRLTGLLC
jgi:CRP-like cAMP-binding protein